MAMSVILAIRRINDRLKGLNKRLGADSPIVEQYQAKMKALVPEQYLWENKDGLLKIKRSKDFEKMGYTAERDFNLDKFMGIQELRKEYKSQFEVAKKEGAFPAEGLRYDMIDAFIGNMAELKENIPLLYKNTQKEGVQEAIDTLHQKYNSYDELLNIAELARGLENAADTTDNIGSHTIPFD